jgi:hypothetical protein
VLPRNYLLDDAHAQAKALEKLLIDNFEGNAGVLVHMDPCEPEECPVCRQPACDQRDAAADDPVSWDRDRLTLKKGGHDLN